MTECECEARKPAGECVDCDEWERAIPAEHGVVIVESKGDDE